VTALDRPLRFLLVDAGGDEAATLASVQAAVPPSSDVERTATMTEALERLDGEPPVDVVLLDPDVPDRTVVEAFAAAHARAPDVPVVVLTRVEGDYLALAIAAVTRSPQSAAAGTRRIAAPLPRYLEHREADVTAFRDALECED
jgi:CheY-like chemotaxis protein